MGANTERTGIGRALAVSLPLCALLLAPVVGHAAGTIASAARLGDVDQVRALLAQGSQVDQAERDGSSAVLWAAYQSDLELLQLLIDAGADLDAANRLGVNPLMQAARVGDAPVIRALVEAGASIDAATVNGETALMAAARAGSADAVRFLLEQGADPNAVEDYQGQTALMWAAAEGHTPVVSLLLEAGADPDMQARISDLTERSTRTDFPTGGFSAAMWAAREGYEDMLKVLAAAGADLNLVNGDGASALSIAIVNDRFDLAADLVSLGADPNDGSLFRAVEMRDAPSDWRAKDGSRLRVDYRNELTGLDLMRVLLEAGADPNKVFSGQNHSASMCCDTKANGTPFSRTASAADVEGLKLMVAYGADVEWMPEPEEDSGRGGGGGGPVKGGGASKTPLQAAMNGGKGIGMAGGPGDIREGEDVPFREVANRNPADAMAVLLTAGADPNRELSSGSTLLHDAARARRLDVVEVLAAHGIQLDALNRDGLTALDVAEGRRAEGGGGGRQGGGPPLGGGLPGGPTGSDDQPSQAEIAARLRELMDEAGVPVFEHGVAPGGGAD